MGVCRKQPTKFIVNLGELMAYIKILTIPDETLRKPSKPVTAFDASLHELLADMQETLRHYDGVGLSAVQIGVLKRVFIIDVGNGVTEYINPTIVSFSGKQKGNEGCLSIPNEWHKVTRPNKVTIQFYDRNGAMHTETYQGLQARAVFHENDHLNGILYTDHVKKQKSEM